MSIKYKLIGHSYISPATLESCGVDADDDEAILNLMIANGVSHCAGCGWIYDDDLDERDYCEDCRE